jgi:succinate dehydrogenase / fumarate reductase, membrane anchor subunit
VSNRIIVGAHYGLRDWLAQRITAIVMALCSVVFAGYALSQGPFGYEQWKALFSHGVVRVLALMFFLSLYFHAWVGVRDILMDYVKPAGWRLALEVSVILALAGYTIWTVSILWSV